MNRPARYLTYALTVIATAGIVACGSDDQDDRNALDNDTPARATKTADPDTLPSCGVVWKKGQDIPRDYAGCMLPDGSESAAMIVECTDGRSWVTHEDRFFGYLGDTITEAPTDSVEYQEAYTTCLMGKE